MMGGASEYVAGCYTNNTNYLTDNTDTSYQNKYIDVYSRYDNSKYGDAVYETSSSSSSSNSWFSDYSIFVESGSPVFLRGGDYDYGSVAGLFYFCGSDCLAHTNYGFRPVCVIWHKIIRYVSSRTYIEYICHTSFIPSVKSVKI